MSEHVAQIVGAQAVADEENLGIARFGDGTEQLDCAARAEIGTADTDDDQSFGVGADLLGGSDDAIQFRLLDLAGESSPAGEIGAETASVMERLVRQRREGVIGAGGGEKGAGAGEIDLDHIQKTSCFINNWDITILYITRQEIQGQLSGRDLVDRNGDVTLWRLTALCIL